MITPISNNLSVNNLSNIERPRIPRRFNPSNNIGFTGNNSIETNGFLNNFFKSVQQKTSEIVNSKPIQIAKNETKKFFYKTINTVKNIPNKIGGFFNSVADKITKKA